MKKKKIVIALGHEALGTTLPEQKEATKRTAKAVADFIREDYQVVITHSNGPQIGMIHTAMNEFCKLYPEYTATPMSVCSAMSQGYIGYDLQNAIRAELLNKGIYKPVSTILTQVVVDPYDEAFYKPSKVIGRVLTEEEAEAEEKKGNHVVKTEGGYRRIVAAPKPMDIVEIDAGDTYAYDADGLKTQKAREDAAKERIFSLLPEDQKQELVRIFDEFEAFQTPEAKFARAMDNLQPLLLNDSNDGGDWKEHEVNAEKVYGRQRKTKRGSEKLFEVTDQILKENIAKGNLPE